MYQAGIYCRISIEEQNKEGEYSNSIHSQIQMARDYIAENKDIAEKKVYVIIPSIVGLILTME